MENENINLGDTYEIVRQIGSGGGGTVYLAYHNRLQKNVVIKRCATVSSLITAWRRIS